MPKVEIFVEMFRTNIWSRHVGRFLCGTAMGTKVTVASANIIMSKVETDILSQSAFRPLVWGEQPSSDLTAEVFETETSFLDIIISKGKRFPKESF